MAKIVKKKAVKKAQNGKLEYTYPSGNKLTVDTSGYAAGAKRFPIKMTGYKRPPGLTPGSVYGKPTDLEINTNRKGARRMIEYTEGKRKTPEPTPFPIFGRKIKNQKTGGKTTSKAKKGATIKKSVKKK